MRVWNFRHMNKKTSGTDISAEKGFSELLVDG